MKFNKLFSLFILALVSIISLQMGDPEVMAASSIIVTTDADRGVYDRIKEYLVNRFGEKQYVITPTDLRMENLASPNENSYIFDPYENNAQESPLENRLNRNDLFIATHIAVCLSKRDLADQNPRKYANYPLITFPDPVVFSEANESESLETVFQGKITFSTSSMIRQQNLLTHHTRYVPERPAVEEQGVITYPQYGPSTEARGYFRLPANIMIDGQMDNKFTLRLGLGSYVNIDGQAAEVPVNRNVIVLLVKGFMVSGVAFNEINARHDQPFS